MTNEEIIEKLSDLEDKLKSTQYDLDEANQVLDATVTELEELKVYTENLAHAYDNALQELPDELLKISDNLIYIDERIDAVQADYVNRIEAAKEYSKGLFDILNKYRD